MNKILMLMLISALLSGCVGVEKEQSYSHAAEGNYTENLTLYPDGQWVGVFYEDRYFPQISLSGVYRNTEKEIILTTPTGNTIIFKKEGKNLTYEDKIWIPK